MSILLKPVRTFDGNNVNQILLTYQTIKSNLVIFWPLQDLMELIKSYNMVREHTRDIVQLFYKLMESYQSWKVKMDGIGLNMVFKEMIGKLGKNGH
jgi:hypothetical protein